MTDTPPPSDPSRSVPTTVVLAPGQEHLARRVLAALRAEGLTGPLAVVSWTGVPLVTGRRIVSTRP